MKVKRNNTTHYEQDKKPLPKSSSSSKTPQIQSQSSSSSSSSSSSPTTTTTTTLTNNMNNMNNNNNNNHDDNNNNNNNRHSDYDGTENPNDVLIKNMEKDVVEIESSFLETFKDSGSYNQNGENIVNFLCSMFQLDTETDGELVLLLHEENGKELSKTIDSLLDMINQEESEKQKDGICSSELKIENNVEDVVKLESKENLQKSNTNEWKGKSNEKKKNKKNNKKSVRNSKPSPKIQGPTNNEAIETLSSIFPDIDREVIQVQLSVCNYDVQLAYQHMALQIEQPDQLSQFYSGSPVNADSRKASKSSKKYIPRPDLIGSASFPNQWQNNNTVMTVAEALKLEKLKSIFHKGKHPSKSNRRHLSNDLIERVFKEENGNFTQCVHRLKQLRPNHSINYIEHPCTFSKQNTKYVSPDQSTEQEQQDLVTTTFDDQNNDDDDTSFNDTLEEDNNDYQYAEIPGENSFHYRSEAQTLSELRNKYFQLALQAYSRGDGVMAKELSEKGRHADELMRTFHLKASELIFQEKNRDRGKSCIDLHGLRIDEALAKIQKEIQMMEQGMKKKITLVTGVGHHSENGKPRLRPAVLKYLESLKKSNIKVKEINPGVIKVYLQGKTP